MQCSPRIPVLSSVHELLRTRAELGRGQSMVPEAFHDYFIASTGAGAALVGLLFVAISIAPERTVMRSAPVERRAVALSAYTALLNAFFLSMVALLPQTNLGGSTHTQRDRAGKPVLSRMGPLQAHGKNMAPYATGSHPGRGGLAPLRRRTLQRIPARAFTD